VAAPHERNTFIPNQPMTQPAFTVVRDGEALPPDLRRAFIAIGNFDGVHRGHRAVIDRAIELAREDRRPGGVLPFEPHPRAFFRKDQPLFRLTPEPEKLKLLAAAGLDGAVVMQFDGKLAGVPDADLLNDSM